MRFSIMPQRSSTTFSGRYFERVMILSVRWYIGHKVSCRDLVEMVAARGVISGHTTVKDKYGILRGNLPDFRQPKWLLGINISAEF
jgi:hypothetical protein